MSNKKGSATEEHCLFYFHSHIGSGLNVAAYLFHLHPAGAFAGILADGIAGALQAAGTGVFANRLERTLLTAYEQDGGSITDAFYGRLHHIDATGAFSGISGRF